MTTATPRLKNSASTSRNIFSDIQKTLVIHKAQQVNFMYVPDGSGYIHAIEFSIIIDDSIYQFRLPARIRNVEVLLYGNKFKLTQTQKDQAYRTAWANIRDWISSQCAMIDTGMVKPEEVFLPYMIEPGGKRTFFEVLSQQQFLLGSGNHGE